MKAVEFQTPQAPQAPEARAAYLDENFEVLKTLAVPSHTKTELGTETRFQRGDVNDDGRLNITNPILLVLHLLQGVGPLPAPATFCGNDPTEDDLSCGSFAACDG